ECPPSKAAHPEKPASGSVGSIGIVEHRQATSNDLRLALCKGAIQKQRAICQMNPVCLQREVLQQRSQLHQLYNVADLAWDIAHCAAAQFVKYFAAQRQVIGHTAIRCEKSPACVDDFVPAEKIITKQGFVDTFAIKPDELADLTRLLVLRHGAAPPFPDVSAAAPVRRWFRPSGAYPPPSRAAPVPQT